MEYRKELVAKIHAIQNKIDADFKLAKKSGADAEGRMSEGERVETKAQLQVLFKELEAVQGENPLIQVNVGSQAIAEVVANWTGIPVGKMVSNEIQQVLNLAEVLGERVIGQPHALEAIARHPHQPRRPYRCPQTHRVFLWWALRRR